MLANGIASEANVFFKDYFHLSCEKDFRRIGAVQTKKSNEERVYISADGSYFVALGISKEADLKPLLASTSLPCGC